jgi:transcriptional regulator with XRE-family HTH domain
MNREKLGNDLRMFIFKHDITQEAMGRLTDTSSSTISRILRGEDGITDETLKKVEEALRVLNDQTDDQIKDESEDETKEQTLKSNKSKNTDHLSFEANGTKFKHDKKNKCLHVKNKDIDLKITLI